MKNVRMLIVGMVAGAILATSATAFAGPVSSKISALLRPDMSVTINGKQIKNAPINYNGTTYLPLRETSDAFGGKLDLQGKAITITQKGADSMNAVESGWISLLDFAKEHDLFVGQTPESNGKFLVKKGDSVLFEIDAAAVSSGETTVTSSSGTTIRIKSQLGSTLLNYDDLKSAGLIN